VLSQVLFIHHTINKNKVASVNKHRSKKANKYDRDKSPAQMQYRQNEVSA